jgi:hypothetical protein
MSPARSVAESVGESLPHAQRPARRRHDPTKITVPPDREPPHSDERALCVGKTIHTTRVPPHLSLPGNERF